MRHTSFSSNSVSGSTYTGETNSGGLLTIYNRHHDCAKVGMWLVTLVWYAHDTFNQFSRNIDAIVDDYGNLVPMHNRD